MRLLAIVSALFFSGMVASAPVTNLHNIVVFGDSLSDNGNLYEAMNHQLPQSPPYFEGRFSNGPVWIEHLVSSYFPKNPNTHLKNYAYAGSAVSLDESDDEVLFTLRRQVNLYLSAQQDKASAEDLYVIWIGANNYLTVNPENQSDEELNQVAADVNQGIVDSLERLVKKGAKHIMLVNIPDLGRIPAAVDFEAVDILTYLSKQHNTLLLNSYELLKQKYSDVQWIYFDMNTAFGAVVDEPQNYGFTNTTEPCLDLIMAEDTDVSSVLQRGVSSTSAVEKDLCAGYLFFDPVHPTRDAHETLAKKARDFLDAEGVVLSE